MAIRNINSPAVQITEIDKSQYASYSQFNKTNVFACGFAAKGDDYLTTDINSLAEFVNKYGYPTNDPERFLYHAVENVLNEGGNICVSKLPYCNISKDKYAYVDYIINDKCIQDVDCINELSTADPSLTSYVEIDSKCTYSTKYNIKNLSQSYFTSIMKSISAVYSAYDKTFSINVDAIQTDLDKKNALNEILNELTSTLESNAEKQCKLDQVIADVEAITRMANEMNELMSRTMPNGTTNSQQQALARIENEAKAQLLDVDVMSYGHTNALEGIVDSIQKIFTMPSVALAADLLDLTTLDDYRTQSAKPAPNTIRIVDIARNKYSATSYIDNEGTTHRHSECLGYLPVITTAPNAMYIQGLLGQFSELVDGQTTGIEWSAIADILTFGSTESLNFSNTSLNLPVKLYDNAYDSISKRAAQAFPLIDDNVTDTTLLDQTHMKDIGVVLFELVSLAGGKITVNLIESYLGSLDPKAKDQQGRSMFIDDVVNSQSYRINVFSNCTMSRSFNEARTLVCIDQVGSSLGFYEADCAKTIDYKLSLIDPLNKIFENNRNIDDRHIDIVIDAGMSNFGQFISLPNPYGRTGTEVIVSEDDGDFGWHVFPNSLSKELVTRWKTIIQKFDEFCRLMRKDCIFIADNIRGFGLDGNARILTKYHPDKTFENTLAPYINVLAAVNSSYSLGYAGWVSKECSVTGDTFWCPPSVEAVRNYVRSDANGYFWNAVAGLNRGAITDINGLAIEFDVNSGGAMYSASWNYIMNQYKGTFTMEGIKTFQSNPSALDRVPVRRLLLWLERAVRLQAKLFVYEQNTETNRNRFVNTIDPYFKIAKKNDGILDYRIICNDSNNTPQSIDNNELNVRIEIKPVHAIEWILVDFVCAGQNVNLTESLRVE